MAEKSNQGASGASKGAESQAPKENIAQSEVLKPGEVKLVKMVRTPPYDGPEPHKADVHPDEVAKWSNEGWMVAK